VPDDQYAGSNTVPSGCPTGGANADCPTKTIVTCEFGQDLCSGPSAAGCFGGFMGATGSSGNVNGNLTAIANVNASSVVKGQIPNQVFRDYYYVKLALPDFGRSLNSASATSGSPRAFIAPTETVSLNLYTNGTGAGYSPGSSSSPVFFMRAYPYGSYTDGYSIARTLTTVMGSAPATYTGASGCSVMTQVLGNGETQNYAGFGSFAALAGLDNRAAAATFDLTHYTWNDGMCANSGSRWSDCSTNVAWPNQLVIEVRRTTWAGSNVTAPWEWAPGGLGHGLNNNLANQSSQNTGPGCGFGTLKDASSCNLNQAITGGASPTMPTNYYTLSMAYSTGANP